MNFGSGRTGAAVLLFALNLFAQVVPVEGVIKWVDGSPVNKAVVKFDGVNMKGRHMKFSTKTDKDGHYSLRGVPFGKFDVSVELGGKEVNRLRNFSTVAWGNGPRSAKSTVTATAAASPNSSTASVAAESTPAHPAVPLQVDFQIKTGK